MANAQDLYKYLVDNLQDVKISKSDLAKPDPTLEDEVTKIYTQARTHRDRLIYFYIGYTVLFSIFVIGLIAIEAYARIKWQDTKFEAVPQNALNLLVTGMFAQFVSLLAIVTRKVWDFEPFFTHHNHIKHPDK